MRHLPTDVNKCLNIELFKALIISLITLLLLELLAWFGGYSAAFLVSGVIVFILVNNGLLIKQKYRGDGIYLNGMEYMFYGVPAIVVFGMLCIVFHLIYFKIKKHRNSGL